MLPSEPSQDQASQLPSQLYAQALIDFENGSYQAAIAKLEQANKAIKPLSIQSGEIQIWLANGYDAVGRTVEAIAICEKLKNHPDRQIRKSAAFVQEIISAPKLSPITDGNLTIPSLSDQPSDRYRYQNAQNKPKPEISEIPTPVPTDTKFQKSDRLAFVFAIAIVVIYLIFFD
jgi:tetratricopeptide (TPR) repeat protein